LGLCQPPVFITDFGEETPIMEIQPTRRPAPRRVVGVLIASLALALGMLPVLVATAAPVLGVEVVTCTIALTKTDTSQVPLAGAGFTLYLDDGDQTFGTPADTVVGTEQTTDVAGLATWTGLACDMGYFLVESTTPTGYVTLDPVLVSPATADPISPVSLENALAASPTPVSTATPTPAPTATPVASDTPTPGPSDTPAPSTSATPVASVSPSASASPHGSTPPTTGLFGGPDSGQLPPALAILGILSLASGVFVLTRRQRGRMTTDR
jgi:uncharacterized surface anchored protein